MDTDGRPLAADIRPARAVGTVSLTPGETHLPFLLLVSAVDTSDRLDASARRTVLAGSLGVALFLMLAAAYGLYRATTRELRLARQQSDFVSAVSHEFRTPLTAMRHLTDLLVTRSNTTSDDRKAQYYELLARETERLQRMVETLLGFGRIEAGAYAWRLEPVDAGDVLKACVDEFRSESLAGGRAISCELDEPLPLIQADREALARAVWNLLENAAKYSPPGSPIRVFGRSRHPSVVLGVTDEGVGIPTDEQNRIFQKFVRGSAATRAGAGGIGLGLTLVARIAEAHGGSVRLDSEPGRGSTFTLVIPCPAS
jgi:signal transduction histidine kinase